MIIIDDIGFDLEFDLISKRNNNLTPIEVGDLVQFDVSHAIGIVINIIIHNAFKPDSNIQDIYVYWNDGEAFWCSDFTLKIIAKKM